MLAEQDEQYLTQRLHPQHEGMGRIVREYLRSQNVRGGQPLTYDEAIQRLQRIVPHAIKEGYLTGPIDSPPTLDQVRRLDNYCMDARFSFQVENGGWDRAWEAPALREQLVSLTLDRLACATVWLQLYPPPPEIAVTGRQLRPDLFPEPQPRGRPRKSQR
jgi:hypothetical protein